MSLSAEMLLVPECEELQRRLLFMPDSVPCPRIFIVIVKCFDCEGIPLCFNDDFMRSTFNSPLHDQLFTQWEDSEIIYSPFRTPSPPVNCAPSLEVPAMPILPTKKLRVQLCDIFKGPNTHKYLLPKFNIDADLNAFLVYGNTAAKDVTSSRPLNNWFNNSRPSVLSPSVSCRKLNDRDLVPYLNSSHATATSIRPDEMVSDLDNLFDNFTTCLRLNREEQSFYREMAETMSTYGNAYEECFSKARLNSLANACLWDNSSTTNIIKELRLKKISSDNIHTKGGLVIFSECDIEDFLSSAKFDFVNKKNIRFGIYSPPEEEDSPLIVRKQLRRVFHKKSLFLLHHSVLIDSKFGPFCEFVLQENLKKKRSVVVVIPIMTLQFVLKLILKQQVLDGDFYTTRRNLFSLSSLLRGGWCILAPYENVGPSSSMDTLLECLEDIHAGFEYAHKEVTVVVGGELGHLSRLSGYYKIRNL